MNSQTTTTRVALKWGVVAGVASMVFTTILYMSGQAANPAFGWLGFIIPIVTIFLAMKEFRTENGGYMSYGQGLGIGALLSAISGFISSTYAYIYNEFIDSTVRQQIMDKVREDMESKGMSDEQIESALEISSKYSTPGYTFIFGILGAILLGVIISLIIAAIMKKDKPFELE